MDRILKFMIQFFVVLSGFTRTLARLGIGAFEEWQPGSRIRILMVGYNGARNTGADARVAAAVKQIKDLFGEDDIEISVITLSEELLQGYFDEDVRLLKISSIFLKDLYRACSTHHVAILCEGSTLKSTFANALSLFFCEASGIMSRQNKPCITFGSEVGSMEPFLRRYASKVCRDTYFITRTQQSQEVLSQLGLSGHVGTDTAWLYDGAIDAAEAEQLLRSRGWDGKAPLLGAAVIDPFCWPVRASFGKWIRGLFTGRWEGQYDKWYFYSDSADRRAEFRRYTDEIGVALNVLCEENGFFPVLLGMERMDVKACDAVMQSLERPCAVFLSGDTSADIMAGILSRLDALITSRYHAAVLSMKDGCPIVAVSMDERLDSLMKELSFDEDYLHHVLNEDLGARVVRSLSAGYERREQLREHIRTSFLTYQEKQREMGAFLRDYILEELNRRNEQR